MWLFLRAIPALLSGKLRLLDAEYFLALLLDSRICWIRGMLGGGKTSLAFILAGWLLENAGYKFVASNIPNKFPRPSQYNGVDNCVTIFDEGGLFLDSRDWQSNPRQLYVGLRKFNACVLLPSKNPVDKRLQELIVQPVKRIGRFIWVYEWFYELGAVSRSGQFSVVNPFLVFDYFETKPLPLDDRGLLGLFDISIKRASQCVGDWLAYSN